MSPQVFELIQRLTLSRARHTWLTLSEPSRDFVWYCSRLLLLMEALQPLPFGVSQFEHDVLRHTLHVESMHVFPTFAA